MRIQLPPSLDGPAKTNFGLRFRLAVIAGEMVMSGRMDRETSLELGKRLAHGYRDGDRVEIPAVLADAWKNYPGRERYAAFEIWSEETK